MQIPEWTRLDNAALIYPSSRTKKYASMFRLSVTLDRPVEEELLQQALLTSIQRFPGFRYTLGKGLFWWFLQRLENPPRIRPAGPLKAINFRKNGGYMFKLSCEGCRIDLDVFHALTDGTGAMTFLMSLTGEYLRLRHATSVEYGKWVLNPREEASPEEFEDAFDSFSGTVGSLDREEKAYHLKGRIERHNVLNILRVSLSATEILAKAKEMDCTLTELLTALMLVSMQQVREEDRSRGKSPYLRVEVPVNLRPLFGKKTLRNFSSYVHIGLDVRNGSYSLEEALREVRAQKRLLAEPRRLTARVAANVSLEESLAIRLIPLFIKRPVINFINRLKGDNYCTYTFSNLGRIDLPEAMAGHVEELDFLLGRSLGKSGSCACVSCGDRVVLNFSRRIVQDRLERCFLENLEALGVRYEMMTTDGNAVLNRTAEDLPIRKAFVRWSRTMLLV